MSKKYRTVLNTRPLMFQETRIVARLKQEGFADEEIIKEVLNHNLFQLASMDRSRSFYYEIKRRLDLADQFILSVIANGQAYEAKLAIFYLILKVDQLLAEFMQEVWLDKYQRKDFKLLPFDFAYFFNIKREQSEQIRTWATSTLRHLQSAYLLLLYQVGFVIHRKLPTELIAPLLSPNLDNYFREHKYNHLAVLMYGGL